MEKDGQENFPAEESSALHCPMAPISPPSLAVSANDKKPEPVFQKLVLRCSAQVAA